LVLADVGRVGQSDVVLLKRTAGLVRAYLTYRKIAAYSHQNTVNGVTGGSERVLCEDCGDVTIRYESMISGDVDRSKFSRDADPVDIKVGARSKP
jgi:hypothetical protein